MAEAHSNSAAPTADRPAHPPKPRFALTVGIVGHRLEFWLKPDPDRYTPEQAARIRDHRPKVCSEVRAALEAIKTAAAQAYQNHASLFDDSADAKLRAPDITLISALADGADTFAADAAHELGYALDAPLPFAQSDYENDFGSAAIDANTPAPIESFRKLIGKARSVLQLPGQRGGRRTNRAYEAAGHTVLSQADILLAVWDHELTRGRGGTAEMVAEAARIGIPIILVDATGDHDSELRWRGLQRTPAPIVAFDDLPSATLDASVNRVIDELVRPPQAPEQRKGLQRWYGEIRRGVNLAIPFSLLMTALRARTIRSGDILPDGPDELAAQYVAAAAPAVQALDPIAHLAEPYGWADAVANHCSQFFRSAFVVNFFFAALAVIAGSASVMTMNSNPGYKLLPVGTEIALILCVVGNTWLGHHWFWHHRWVEAREIAERFRAALPLWTLGLRPASFPGEEPTWTGWYTRAMVRMQRLRSADLSGKNLADERLVLLNLIKDQRGYNHTGARRMHLMERRLEGVGLGLLGLTLAVAGYHFLIVIVPALCASPVMVIDALDRIPLLHPATIWLSAALPALATATYGIRVIGDFEGIHQRGERTFRQLRQLAAAVKRDAGMPLAKEDTDPVEDAAAGPDIPVQQDPIDFALLRARARTAADVLLGDVSSWRLSAESRGLAIPG